MQGGPCSRRNCGISNVVVLIHTQLPSTKQRKQEILFLKKKKRPKLELSSIIAFLVHVCVQGRPKGDLTGLTRVPQWLLTFGASQVQNDKLNIEHAGWRTRLLTLRELYWNFSENHWAQNRKSPERVFSKTKTRRPLKFVTHTLRAKRNLTYLFQDHIASYKTLYPHMHENSRSIS